MTFQISLIESQKYLELVYSGFVPPAELYEAMITSFSLSITHQTYLFLADLTNMTGGHSIVDLYDLISKFDTSEIERKLKEAIILPEKKLLYEDVMFYETACTNRGFNIKIFSNREEALIWLLS